MKKNRKRIQKKAILHKNRMMITFLTGLYTIGLIPKLAVKCLRALCIFFLNFFALIILTVLSASLLVISVVGQRFKAVVLLTLSAVVVLVLYAIFFVPYPRTLSEIKRPKAIVIYDRFQNVLYSSENDGRLSGITIPDEQLAAKQIADVMANDEQNSVSEFFIRKLVPHYLLLRFSSTDLRSFASDINSYSTYGSSYKKASLFVDYVLFKIHSQYPTSFIQKNGLKVYTTLDLSLQNRLQKEMLESQAAATFDNTDVVIFDYKSGNIFAAVSSDIYAPNYRRAQTMRHIEEQYTKKYPDAAPFTLYTRISTQKNVLLYQTRTQSYKDTLDTVHTEIVSSESTHPIAVTFSKNVSVLICAQSAQLGAMGAQIIGKIRSFFI